MAPLTKNTGIKLWLLLCACFFLLNAAKGYAQAKAGGQTKMLGMYVHMHWSFHYPYAARTWSLEDWKGYLSGINRLGYNTVVIWPVIETMPEPLTYSDKAHLEKMSAVAEMARKDFRMRVYFTLTPNVSAQNEEAAKYTLEKRPYNYCSELVNPKKPADLRKMMEKRARLCQYLKGADGFFLIDGDPGGWPDCRNEDFVEIFSLHRKMLNNLRPGLELYVWTHQGWETTGKMYSGNGKPTSADDLRRLLTMLSKNENEPWGVAGSRYENDIAEIAGSAGVKDKVITFKYGFIEREPSFPFTSYNDGVAYKGGQDIGARGILGNAQQHCVQLPNTFALARGARGLKAERDDYISFANDLIPGQGLKIVEAWEALMKEDAAGMHQAAGQLTSLLAQNLEAGSLGGLLFNDPHRFVEDLVLQLRARASIHEFILAADRYPKKSPEFSASLKQLILNLESWQRFHGFSGFPRSTRIPGLMEELMKTLLKLDYAPLTEVIEMKNVTGATPFEKDINRHKYYERYTLYLIKALKDALRDLEAS